MTPRPGPATPSQRNQRRALGQPQADRQHDHTAADEPSRPGGGVLDQEAEAAFHARRSSKSARERSARPGRPCRPAWWSPPRPSSSSSARYADRQHGPGVEPARASRGRELAGQRLCRAACSSGSRSGVVFPVRQSMRGGQMLVDASGQFVRAVGSAAGSRRPRRARRTRTGRGRRSASSSKLPCGGGDGGRPLQRVAVPGVARRPSAPEQAVEEVHHEDQLRHAQQHGADGHELVQRLNVLEELVLASGRKYRRRCPPTPRMCIGKNVQLENMNVRAKWTLPQRLVHHPAEHLREPEVDRPRRCRRCST